MKTNYYGKLAQITTFILITLYMIQCGQNDVNNNKLDDNLNRINDIHYNIPDPDCTGPFGLCTQEDKDRLGYLAIKKLHEKMDDDRDGQIEIKETKEFMTEELQYKNGANEREIKFHGSDSLISVDEMWKSWQYSQVYNWTVEDVVIWVNEQVKLPQYANYFRRNQIDGQFLPRLAINENHYYSNVMQIKDSRHKRLLMIKATDIVLFGQQAKPHNLIKDALLFGALTASIIFSLFLYSKHRESLDKIKRMMTEVEKLGANEENETLINQLKNNLKSDEKFSDLNSPNSQSTLSLFSLKKRSIFSTSRTNSTSDSVDQTDLKDHLKQTQIITAKNQKLTEELNKAKIEADYLRRARENTDGQLRRLELAEQELDKVRAALRQTEARQELVKFQPPQNLINLLNRTYESERELLEYKFNTIKKEKEACYDSLNKISKRQSGLLGALKIAHSSTLEEINHKLEILKHEIQKCKTEKHEWTKRWNNIDELCNKANENVLYENSSLEQLAGESPSDETFKANVSNIPPNNSLAQLNQQSVKNNVSTIQNKKPYQNKSISNFKQSSQDETKSQTFYNSVNQLNINAMRPMSMIEQPLNENKVEFDLNIENDDSNNNNIKTKNYNDENQGQTTLVNTTNIPQQPIQKTNVTIIDPTNGLNQKIARESLIHKNDVFQFDDVESVHTHDSLFRQTPQSSFELDDTRYEPSKAKKKLTSLITPLLRTVNQSQSSSINKPSNKVKPQRNPSFSSQNSSPKLIKKGEKTSSLISLERRNTFSKHLNSLKKKLQINSKTSSQNLIIPNDDLVKSTSVDLIPIPSSKELQFLKPHLNENTSSSVDNFHDQNNKTKAKKLFSFRLSKNKKKSEFWKSNPKKLCDYCKIWIQDNKASISIHENGRKHKEEVRKKLEEIKKKSVEKKNEEKIYQKSMAAIEKAAMAAMQNDLSSNPNLRNQYGSATKLEAKTEIATTSKEVKKQKHKDALKPETGVKRKSGPEPEAKMGKWETVEAKKPHLEVIPSKIDLQLPTKTTGLKKIQLNIEDTNEENSHREQIKEEEPKSKWKPLDSFQSVDTNIKNEEKIEESATSLVTDTINTTGRNSYDEIKSEDKIDIPVKQEPIEEKIPTLKNSNKKDKIVTFKKRTKEVSLRERTTD
ncbi:unnamed protein product [Brachionus calyciflorus]|uniref:Uncharacterized protein n=1 Tax=Brachionus calyciflorus TaxID=104777 RepID=A0A813NCL0_9BILA|nr:unnamed protein product [Brachionus calyciflorus]